VRYASEFVPIAADTYAANAPGTYVDRRDIREVKPEFVLKKCRVAKGELDYLDGSPPCKIFSKASLHTKGKRDETNVVLYSEGIKQRVDDLFFQFARLLKGTQPKVFVAENVEGLTAQANRPYLNEIFSSLRKCGYEVEARVLDASKLGVPQARKRLIFVGVRRDLVKRGFKPAFPKPLNRYITVQDVVPHAVKMKFGGGRGYMSAAQPSQTITASDATTYETADFSCGAYIELPDGTRRKYKISEAKRVFGMPEDFKLLGDYEQRFERLGRIHVPLSVYYVASALRENVLSKL
jgi:DNA (cytosine-5)-methyltransferase 1